MKTRFVVVSGPFYSAYSDPILVAKYKKDAEKWLKDNGWVKSSGVNKGLWEKDNRWGRADWATIIGDVEIAGGN